MKIKMSIPESLRDGESFSIEALSRAEEHYTPTARAQADMVDNGRDGDGREGMILTGYVGSYFDGFTHKDVTDWLRDRRGQDITVEINSPGGDFYTGVSVYEALRKHKGKVTVQIIGLAGSAASVIAMAGDEIEIGEASMIYVHNAVGITIGNKQQHEATMKDLSTFDALMATLYASRSQSILGEDEGLDVSAAVRYMNGEEGSDGTFFTAEEAVANGLATGIFQAKGGDRSEGDGGDDQTVSAHRRIVAAMKDAGIPRVDRERVLRQFKSEISARNALTSEPREASRDHEQKLSPAIEKLIALTDAFKS